MRSMKAGASGRIRITSISEPVRIAAVAFFVAEPTLTMETWPK